MFKINSFAVAGGDRRQVYCGKSIAEDGYSVYYCGLEKSGAANNETKDAIKKCDAVILPVPCSRDGFLLNTPLSDEIIRLDEIYSVLENKPLFCGMAEKLPFRGDMIFDYAKREEFAVENAVPTSEGAIETAMREYVGTINGSKCLVTGYGRIGRVLSSQLKALGADVTVSARKLKDLAFIRAEGMKAIFTSDIAGSYDIIFNTVPHLIFDAQTLARTASKAVVIDLASMPGGVDFEGAERLSIKAVHALSLPGKTAPKTSGIIIKNTVYNIIREERL